MKSEQTAYRERMRREQVVQDDRLNSLPLPPMSVGSGSDPAGTAAAGDAAHVAASDPHPQYLTPAEASAAYDAIGAAAAAQAASQPVDATLSALAGVNWALNSLHLATGADTVSATAFAVNTFVARASTGNLAAKPITDVGLEHASLAAKGTFTPTIVGTTTAGVGTYTTQLGKYTRVGDRVDFKVVIAITAHTGTGNMRVSGLPFTSANDAMDNACTVGRADNLATTAGTYVLAAVPANSAQIILYQLATGGGVSSGITLDPACTVVIAGTYWL